MVGYQSLSLEISYLLAKLLAYLMTFGIQVCLLISWHEHVQCCYEVHAYFI